MLDIQYIDGKGYLIADNKNSEYIALIDISSVVYFGCQTQEVTYNIIYSNTKELLFTFSNISLKAVILSEANVDEEVKKVIQNIPQYHISTMDRTIASILAASEISVGIGEKVSLIFIFPVNPLIYELQFTKEGYEIVEQRKMECGDSDDQAKTKIFGNSNPKEIIMAHPFGKFQNHQFNKILETKKIVKVDKLLSECNAQFIAETAKWLNDKSYVKYFVRPSSDRK